MVNEYHGQFNFLGRLKLRVELVPEQFAQGWFTGRPRGRVIIVTDLPPPNWLRPWFVQTYRGRVLSIWGHGHLPGVFGTG